MKPYPSFKPQVDAEAIRKAVGGFGKYSLLRELRERFFDVKFEVIIGTL